MQGGKYLLIGLLGMYLFFGVLRPSMRKLFRPEPPPAPPPAIGVDVDTRTDAEKAATTVLEGKPNAPVIEAKPISAYERDLEFARQVAQQDPKVVATVVKSWINDER